MTPWNIPVPDQIGEVLIRYHEETEVKMNVIVKDDL